ncbi:MAG: spondin domain-containing protein [Paracoccaceae bacterium]
MLESILVRDGAEIDALTPDAFANAAVADPVEGTPGDDTLLAGPGGQTVFADTIDFDILVSSGGFNEGLNAVLRIDGQTGALLGTIPTEGLPEVDGMPGTPVLNDPRDVFLDGPFGALTTNVLVNTGFAPAMPGNDFTLAFDQAGGFLGTFADLGEAGAFVDPGGAVVGPGGDIFVGSRAEGTVFQFDGETGAFVPSDGIPTGGFFDPAEIDFPRGFVFGPDGDLFIGNGSNPTTGEGEDNIFRVDAETRALEVFAAPEGFSPLDVILTPAGDALVVSSEFPFTGGALAAAAPGQVFVFDLETGAATVLDPGTDGTGAPLLLAPRGLGFAPDGRLFASSTANGNLLTFDVESGAFLDVFTQIDGLNGQGFTFVLPEDFDPAAGGIDTFSLAETGEAGAVASLASGIAQFQVSGEVVEDVLVGFEALIGSPGDDVLEGGIGANTLSGGAGDDFFLSDGLDAIDGGEGVDFVQFTQVTEGAFGGAFSGIIVDLDVNSAGPAGTPSQTGGVLDAPPAAGGQTIGDAVLTDIENLLGTPFDDGLFGNNEVNVIEGDFGDDVIHGFGGDDFLSGGGGVDTALFSAAGAGVAVDLGLQVSQDAFGEIAFAGADPVIAATGGAGNTVLEGFENVTGSAFDDTITGDDGANLLVGGAGDDRITGDPAAGEAVRVTVTNLLPEGGTFATPVWFGFHDGSFDLFDFGASASLGLERLAEDGTIETIGAEFADATGAGGVAGAVFGFDGAPGPIDPGESTSATLFVDPDAVGPGFFTWATMVIPSNDAFLSNPDDPAALAIFDADGSFAGPITLTITGADVRDAGTEANTEEEAAFLNQTAPDTGVEENGTVAAHPGFNGSAALPDALPQNILGGTTAPGAVIDPLLGDFTLDPTAPIFEIVIDLAPATDDTLIGGAGSDTLEGGAGDDLFVLEASDTVFGGDGFDTVRLEAGFEDVTIDAATGGFTLIEAFGGTSFVGGIERIELADAAFEIDRSEAAADVFRLFDFATGEIPDPGALSAVVETLAEGVPLSALATVLAAGTGLLDTEVSDVAFVDGLYTDGLERPADAAGLDFWSGLLEDGLLDRGDVLVAFAQSAEAEALFGGLTDDGVLLLV